MFRHGLRRAQYWLGYIAHIKSELLLAAKEMNEDLIDREQRINYLKKEQNTLRDAITAVVVVASQLPVHKEGGEKK